MSKSIKKLCSLDGCSKKSIAKGLCSMHYSRLSRTGSVGTVESSRERQESQCIVEGCSLESHSKSLCHNHYREKRRRQNGAVPRAIRPTVCSVESCSNKHYSLGYCAPHYGRLKSTGDVKEDMPIKELVYGRTSCDVSGCLRPHWANGLCRTHDQTARTYSLSADTLIDMLSRPCALCGSFESPSIDHDHSCCDGAKSCGKCVRGTLCHKCNRGLGQFNDDQDLLKKALDYLKKGYL